MNRKIEIIQILTALEEYYNVTLTDNRKRMFTEDLLDLEPEELARAVRLYRQDPKNTRFPLPSQLRGILRPTDDQQARDAVSRISKALMLYGDPYGHSPDRQQKAKDFVGGLGWAVVDRMGGWMKLSQAGTLDPSEAAQWRELAVSLLVKFRLGQLNDAPALGITERKKTPSLESLSDVIKRIGPN